MSSKVCDLGIFHRGEWGADFFATGGLAIDKTRARSA